MFVVTFYLTQTIFTMKNTAVVILDLTHDFVHGELKTPRALKVLEPLKRLVDYAHQNDLPVIYVSDAHLDVDRELEIWGPHSMKGTIGAEITAELPVEDKDYLLEKRTYSGFFETGLDSLLRDLKVDSVMITGLHTNMCCRHTSADAYALGYKILVPEETTNAFSEEEYVDGLAYLKRMYLADVRPLEEFLQEEPVAAEA